MKKEEKYNLHELQLAMMKYPPKWGHYIMSMSPPSMYGKSLTAKWIDEKCPDIMVVDKSLLDNYRLSEENNKD